MFDSFYPFINIGTSVRNPFADDKKLLQRVHYKFTTEDEKVYLVEVLCYINALYAVEFFLREDKNNKKHVRYGKLTNDYRLSRIVRTCFEIMVSLLQKDSNASFAFIGAATFDGDSQIESIEATKRFKIYRYASINLLGDKSFEQFGDEHTSCYLIANNKANKRLIKEEAGQILKSLF